MGLLGRCPWYWCLSVLATEVQRHVNSHSGVDSRYLRMIERSLMAASAPAGSRMNMKRFKDVARSFYKCPPPHPNEDTHSWSL